jgi:ubiquinone/menaquinone biosynthesis C-methylase UbiE
MTNPAETYESYMVPVLFRPWAERLLERARPRPGERVLDVATGTGIVARTLAARAGPDAKVTGLDLSPAMLEVARAAAEKEGATIEWREGRAEELPFPDDSFDLVTCQFALMFFTDRQKALSEMRRVLDRDGRAVFSVFQPIDRHPFYETLNRAIERRLGTPGVLDIFALGDADELRALLSNAGFRDVEIEQASLTSRFPEPDAFLAGEIDVDTAAIPAMQHLDAAGRKAVTEAIRADMEEALRKATDDGHVALTFHVHLVSARVGE